MSARILTRTRTLSRSVAADVFTVNFSSPPPLHRTQFVLTDLSMYSNVALLHHQPPRRHHTRRRLASAARGREIPPPPSLALALRSCCRPPGQARLECACERGVRPATMARSHALALTRRPACLQVPRLLRLGVGGVLCPLELGGGVLLVLAGLELERFFGNGPLPCGFAGLVVIISVTR